MDPNKNSQLDSASRGSRRSKGRTSSTTSSKREIEKEKYNVKIRFLEEQTALEERILMMEMEVKKQEMEVET